MFDSTEAFKKQFKPVEGGYLVYPSRKLGGKLVSGEEYDRLIKGWEQVAGRKGRWKTIGIFIVVEALWILLSYSVSVPEWVHALSIFAMIFGVLAWLLWASTAPRRLVKDRPAITPPRAVAEARQEARAALNWPLIVLALVLSGNIFLVCVTATERSLSTWAWLVGSGTMFGLYVWIAFKKLTDQAN